MQFAEMPWLFKGAKVRVMDNEGGDRRPLCDLSALYTMPIRFSPMTTKD